ncbi:MAG TPA: hypothetical protein VNP03_28270 [Pseudonocardia sp.]|nr:hypothetical protein [Pseudonocardia sp.]
MQFGNDRQACTATRLALSVTSAGGSAGAPGREEPQLLQLDGLDDVVGDPELRERVLLLSDPAGCTVVLPLAEPRLGGRLCEPVPGRRRQPRGRRDATRCAAGRGRRSG